MSAEDQEMMARISDLAGRINRHKNQQAGIVSRTSTGAPVHSRLPVNSLKDPGYSSSWRRGGSYPYRAHHGRHVPRTHVHRHRSLVLNGSQQARPSESDSGATSDASSSSWVTKNDRHLQLINSSVYEKEAKARTRAIEQTRLQKRTAKDERERAKLINHIHRIHHNGAMGPPGQQTRPAPDQYEVTVQGIRFVVAKNGSKLVKAPGIGNSAQATPKTAVVGGVRFYRSKNGNLYRHGIVKAQRQAGTVKKVNVPCRIFSMTGNSIFPRYPNSGPRPSHHDWGSVSFPEATDQTTLGSCLKGPRCRYIHDPAKVAVCKDFLQQGECLSGDACDLSHDPTPERTPACLHYAKDSCTKPDCRYAHVKVSPGAPVCRPFGMYGYCEKGAGCPDRHVFECPDFSNTGVCKTKGCKLPHRERASALRKANTAKDNAGDVEMEDISSDDDEESVDSDDVDSDEVDEFIGQEAGEADFTEMDYIEL